MFRRNVVSICLVLSIIAIVLAPRSSSVGDWALETHDIVIGDFDGNGHDDMLVVGHDFSDSTSVIRTPDGDTYPSFVAQTWQNSRTHLGLNWHNQQYQFHAGDFNGDNRDDLFLQHRNGNHRILLAEAGGFFNAIDQTLTAIALGAASLNGNQSLLHVGDFDGDGRDDLMVQALDDTDSSALYYANTQYGNGDDRLFVASTSLNQVWSNGHLDRDWSYDRAVISVGQFRGSGQRDDLLLRPRPDVVYFRAKPSFVAQQYGVDATAAIYSVNPFTQALQHSGWDWAMTGGTVDWSTHRFNVIAMDVDGDGIDDVLLQAVRPRFDSQLVRSLNGSSWSSGTSVDNQLPYTNLAGNQSNLIVGDFNGDGSRNELYLQATADNIDNQIIALAANGVPGATIIHTTSDLQVTSTNQNLNSIVAAFGSPVAGTTAGQASVSANGNAHYSLPIVTPAGVKGMSPSLSINYSGTRTTDLAGMGWSVEGFSYITRCPKTLAQDGAVRGVNFTNEDRLCLDGNRLVKTGGAGIDYLHSNAEYKTENETFQRIRSFGPANQSPEYFEVTAADGTRHYYGKYDGLDGRLQTAAGNETRIWGLVQVEDRFSNHMNFSYVAYTGTGELLPASIQYSANKTAATSMKYQVRLNYA
ncbi:MAG: hypothetical protein HKM24_05260, partial [Gammaproteobacteria bacterium]|nr:hypothetical protein [Gammaproteobacteria bacterium]